MPNLTSAQIEEIVVVRDLLRSGDATKIRTAAHLTRSDMAARLGVHASAVARWEGGERVPRPAACLQIATAYADVVGALGVLP